ncbi:MAG: M23 family peptidase, partial [Pedobacter sp.]
AGNYKLNKVNTINVSGEIGFGIVTTDKHTGMSGLNGVYSILLELDEKTVFRTEDLRRQWRSKQEVVCALHIPKSRNWKTGKSNTSV